MPRKTKLVVTLSDEERRELESWQRSTTIRAGLARRGRVILLRADGVPILGISHQVHTRRRHVEKWVHRFLHNRVDGLADKPGRGRKPFFPSGSGDPSGENRVRAA